MNLSKKLANVLARTLGEYVQNVDEDSLQVGLWAGDLQLKNLELRPDALRKAELPVVLRSGSVGTVRLKVPWKSFGSGGVALVVSDLKVVLEP
ncbi:vacuolar protein sorting-associated protein 13A N-terminal domain-containing protein, partial [Tribonema minus]